ncbi:MAG TPA: FAD-dependent oxidoreductase, partial [Variovorax sp.]|nr:FAD-dependent oxidoreductase [Variovorax sp.]
MKTVGIIGAGWAGLACAVEATRLGHAVTLFEAAPMAGGRARRVDHMHGMALDNG